MFSVFRMAAEHVECFVPQALKCLEKTFLLFILAPLDPIVHPGLHGIEGLLELLLREVPDVRLEGLVREVHEAVAEDQLPVVAAADVRFDRGFRF